MTWRERLGGCDPRLLAAAVLVAGLATAPWIHHRFDVELCFLGWARATEGARPWEVYAAGLRGLAPVDCDYPPVVPYLLTLAERLRRWLSAVETGRLAVLLIKLPSLLVWAAAIPLCARILRPAVGDQEARIAAALLALCLPVFINAAVWGQFDGLTAILLMLAVALLVAARPLACGAVLGLILATKLLVIAVLPVVGVWILCRFGLRRLLQAAVVSLVVVASLGAPYVVAGHGEGVLNTYVHAVDYYPKRTMEAYNVWYLLDRVESRWGDLPPAEVRLDTRRVAGALTYRDAGLIAFATYLAYLCLVTWRRPTPEVLVLAAALSLFGFFMLPTQIHGRYLVAAVPLLAVTAARSRLALVLFLALGVTASLGQLIELWRSILEHSYRLDPESFTDIRRHRGLVRGSAVLVSLANLGLFAWATVAFSREAAGRRDRP